MKPRTLAFTVLPSPTFAAEMSPHAFAQKAAASDMFKIEAANFELKKGKSEKIKAFAKDMIKDHSLAARNSRRPRSKTVSLWLL